MDTVTDAMIEDGFWWLCNCETVNQGYCGDDEFICRDCGKETAYDDLVTDFDAFQFLGFDDVPGEGER